MECPKEPDQSECCNSGCNPCIFDVYEKKLQQFKRNLQNEQENQQINCLNELKYVKFQLINIIKDSLHCNIYIFQCNGNDCEQNEDKTTCNVFCEPGQHLLIKSQSKFDKSDFTRAYTPIPWTGLKSNQFAVLIKIYPGGDMSQIIKRLKIDDVTLWRGPYCDFRLDYTVKSILMIAQGTGIAPLYAIAKKLLEEEECEVRMLLVYCCRSLKEVHLRNELYQMLDYWNFKYEMFLSQGITLNDDESDEIDVDDVKYKEIVWEKRLGADDLQNLLVDDSGDDNWSQVLICGNNLFSKSINDVVKSYTKAPVFLF